MIVLAAFAFLSGVITILSPCVLPVLPVVLSGGAGGGKARPFGVIAGFVAGFPLFTLTLTAIVDLLGIPADALRWLAVATIIGFGIVSLVPKLRGLFETTMSLASNSLRPAMRGRSRFSGFLGGIPVGLSLGLVWTPCVGPIMASVISLAVSKNVDGGAVLIAIAYSAGTAIPMLAVMLGGRALLARLPFLSKRSDAIQRGFGVLMIVAGLAIAAQWDRKLQTAILGAFPGYGAGLTALENAAPVKEALAARAGSAHAADGIFSGAATGSLSAGAVGDYGAAPDFPAGATWFNTSPLDLASLRGKVVIVDFWTYSCVNCVRSIPYLQSWYKAYRDKGLVIVGVHSPEFAFEKVGSNVVRAMRDLGVTWPVVLDNDYVQWRAFGNRYWPAEYFIDAKGRVRYWHFGEGNYAENEKVVKALLAEADPSLDVAGATTVSPDDIVLSSKTPETYLGYARSKGFASAVEPVPDAPAEYRPARVPGNGEWTLRGTWTIGAEYSVSSGAGQAFLELGFDAKDVYLVIEPDEQGASVDVALDGKIASDTEDVRGGRLVPDSGRLYHLVSLGEPGGHVLSLGVKGRLRLFAFTFG